MKNSIKKKYYWKHKSEISSEYLKIYRKLQSKYEKNQDLMRKWMYIVNTYKTLKVIDRLLIDKQNEKSYETHLKQSLFRLWKKSKKTIKAVKQAQQDKILKTMFRINLARFQLKVPVLKLTCQKIIKDFLIKVLTFNEFDRRLKRFSIRSKLISE